MRIAALCTVALATFCSATPLLSKESSTAVTVDGDSHLLTTGELVVHVVRTDDLLSDYDSPDLERSLILERLTHVVLRVQLDKEAETLSINDAQLSLGHGHDRVKVVKGEALMLPKGETDVEGRHFDSEGLAALADHALPPGIVAVKITIEEENVEPIAVIKDEEGEDAVVRMKSYQVSLKIVEIDSQAIAHESSLMVPVLKVQLSYQADGKPVEMKAFAIRPVANRNGQKGVEAGHQHHDEEDAEDYGPHYRRPHHDLREPEKGEHPHRHPWHHAPPSPPPFIRWIADLLGFKPPPHPHGGWRHHRPHPDGESEHHPHRRPHHHEGEDDTDHPWRHRIGKAGAHSDAGAEVARTSSAPSVHHGPHSKGEGETRSGRRQWRHGYRRFRHRRLACRLRRFLRRHSATLFVAAFFTKVALLGAFVFIVVRKARRAVRARNESRDGVIRLPESEGGDVGEKIAEEGAREVEIVVEKS